MCNTICPFHDSEIGMGTIKRRLREIHTPPKEITLTWKYLPLISLGTALKFKDTISVQARLCHCAIHTYFHVLAQKKNKFLRYPGAENLLQYWLQMHCDQVLLLAVHYK